MPDFFVSYNRHDRQWAEWIAWQLEEDGFQRTRSSCAWRATCSSLSAGSSRRARMN
jgi:hypothetical protein